MGVFLSFLLLMRRRTTAQNVISSMNLFVYFLVYELTLNKITPLLPRFTGGQTLNVSKWK